MKPKDFPPTSIFDTQPTDSFVDPHDLYDRRPPSACDWRNPNEISKRMTEVPLKAAALLAEIIIKDPGKDAVWNATKARFKHITPDIFNSVWHDIEFAANDKKIYQFNGPQMENYWTLYPHAPNTQQQLRITSIHVDTPTLGLIPMTDKAVEMLPKRTQDCLNGHLGLTLKPAAIVSYSFEIQKYMQTYERSTSLKGTMYTVLVSSIVQSSPNLSRYKLRFFQKTIRVFDERSSALLNIDRKERNFNLMVAHLATANSIAHAFSSGWGLGG